MSKKLTKRTSLEAYLRSIDIELDAETPERIAHFMPTEKSVHLVNLLLGELEDRTSIIVAPYGSGKSLAASYALHMIENRSQSSEVLKKIAVRLEEVSPSLAEFAKLRQHDVNGHGLVIPISGPISSLHVEIVEKVNHALRRFKLGREAAPLRAVEPTKPEELPKYLDLLREKAEGWGFDRIAILWDEFGKHLEFLVQEGRTNQLFHVQKLAEYVARSSMPMSFCTFLHMGFLHYAGTLSQSARTEWRKVEGRFATSNYVDDSKHIYTLIARLVRIKRTINEPEPHIIEKWVALCREHHLFREFADDELNDLISTSYPVTPTALYLLPRLTGRIAQNERTLFHFLNYWDGHSCVRPTELYDYFSPQLKADISIGGTHRVWLETNSALQKVDGDEILEAILKTASLFGLGLDGRSGGARLSLLRQAWREFEDFDEYDPCPVRSLIERKLLLYRQYKDEVAVWHGSDLDLRGHLASEKSRRGASFELIPFLNEQTPPPYLRPLAYNTEFYVRRYFSGEFHALDNTERLTGESLLSQANGDGHVIYLLPDTPEQMKKAKALAIECSEANPLVVMVVPIEPLPLAEAALELQCLFAMQEDPDLVASDPLALEEISQLTSDTEAYLHNLVKRCTEPASNGSNWYNKGKSRCIESHEELRDFLSDVCKSVFHSTPKLNNELINKRRPSAVVVNSRKKLVMGILERSGSKDLGLPLTTPDGTMLRTLLVNTGLYVDRGNGVWGFAGLGGAETSDQGLAEVWNIIGDFLVTGSSEPKPLSHLYTKLISPPYGIREGIFPILLASGIRAFGGMNAIRRNGVSIEDLLPTTIEDMAINHGQYTFEPVSVNTSQQKVLVAFLRAFGSSNDDLSTSNMLRLAGDILAEWKESLPSCTRNRIFDDIQLNGFRDLLFESHDFVEFLTRSLPVWVKEEKLHKGKLRRLFTQFKEQLETADLVYYNKISSALRDALDLEPNAILHEEARSHASLFSNEFISEIPNVLAAQLLRRLKLRYADDDKLCRSVAQLLTERRIQEFNDRVMNDFIKELRQIMQDIDITASQVNRSAFGSGLQKWLITNRRKRITEMYNDLMKLSNSKEAASFINSLSRAKKGQA